MTDLHALLREARELLEAAALLELLGAVEDNGNDSEWELIRPWIDNKDAAVARIDAALAEPQWRPIETAPKDGTQLLLVSEDGVQVVGYWGKHNHVPLYGWLRPVELYGEEVDGLDPTHWMPLPEKP